MPNKSMTTYGLIVLLREVDEIIRICPVILALVRVKRLPFHAIFRRHLAKIGLDDGCISLSLE